VWRVQLLLDPFPFLEGIHLGNTAIQRRDVEFDGVFLVDHALEFRGDFEPSLFVDAGWVIAAKHLNDSVSRLRIRQPGR
jgi:hypothetical protein